MAYDDDTKKIKRIIIIRPNRKIPPFSVSEVDIRINKKNWFSCPNRKLPPFLVDHLLKKLNFYLFV